MIIDQESYTLRSSGMSSTRCCGRVEWSRRRIVLLGIMALTVVAVAAFESPSYFTQTSLHARIHLQYQKYIAGHHDLHRMKSRVLYGERSESLRSDKPVNKGGDGSDVKPHSKSSRNVKATTGAKRTTKRVPKAPRFVQTRTMHAYRAEGARQRSTTRELSPKSSSESNNPSLSIRVPTTGPSSLSSSKKSDLNSNRDRMWKTQRSIDDLEATLAKRWGTDATMWSSGQDGSYYDDDDDEDDEEDGYQVEVSSRARPVYDPWSDSKSKPNSATKPKLSVAHLIRDQPVGGRGTRSQDSVDLKEHSKRSGKDSPSSDNDGGFFFRAASIQRNQDELPTSESTQLGGEASKRNQARQIASVDRSATVSSVSAKPTRAAKSPPLIPLLDRDGKAPLLLTVQQAKRNFQDSLGRTSSDYSTASSSTTESAECASDDDAFLLSTANSGDASWADLGVTSTVLIKNLNRMECPRPLPVQRHVLSKWQFDNPKDARGDLVVGTYTGSGKTLAFLVPLAQQLLQRQEKATADDLFSNVLIMAPGRELASQIASVARDLFDGTGLSVQLAIGGTTFARNLELIRKRKPSILIGTPGRLTELFVGKPGEQRGRLHKIKPKTLVLDEFDALLEYKPHREKTLAVVLALQKRDPSLQTILCSATASDLMTGEESKIDQYLRPGYQTAMADPEDVLVTAGTRAASGGAEQASSLTSLPRVSRTVIHGMVHVPHRRYALETLRRILHTEPLPQQVLVFVEDARKVKIVVEKLERNGINAAPLSGDDDKTDRADVSRALRDGYVGLVVATELAARGLDAPLLTHVINWDLPTDASHYAHRAGRCGRGGRPGVVINLTTSPQERTVPRRFADTLAIDMFTVDVRNGKLNIIDPASQILDAP